jgi:hypothetical protein
MTPCLNDGSCVQNSTDLTMFTCECTSIATGDRCETCMFAPKRSSNKQTIFIKYDLVMPSNGLSNVCVQELGPTFIANYSAAPLSCFAFVNTTKTPTDAYTQCGLMRTDVTNQRHRLVWITNAATQALVKNLLVWIEFCNDFLYLC